MPSYNPMPMYNPGGYVSTMNYGPYGDYGNVNYGANSGGGQGASSPGIGFDQWGPAAIQGAGSLYSTWAGGRARDQQFAATQEGIAYQREQDKRREEAMQAWQANREELLRLYGIDPTTMGDLLR